MPRRLFVQILLIVSAGLVAMTAAFGAWVGTSQGAAVMDAMRENARVLATSEADNAAHFLVVEDYAGLEGVLAREARLPHVVRIRLHEPGGRTLLEIRRERDGTPPVVLYPATRADLPASPEAFTREVGGEMVAWAPISAGKLLGWLEMAYTLRAVEETKASIWRQTALLGAFAILLGALLVALALRRPLGAIRELSVFARDLARRKGERVPVPRAAEEVSALARALDEASVELAEADRQRSAERERLAVTLQSLGEGVIACDGDGNVTLMNAVAEKLTGWTAVEAAGRQVERVFQAVDEGTGEGAGSSLACAIATGHAVDPGSGAMLLARDGTRRKVTGSSAPIVDASGREVGAVVVFRDETERLAADHERRELEAQLRQAQKMEAVGQLAGGIAHDFNNLLTAIIGCGSFILQGTPPGDPRREPAQDLLEAAGRAATLTRRLLAFSRKAPVELRLADLNDVIRSVERMLRRIIGEEVELRADLCPEPAVARLDPAQLEQVLLNLATNARDAMPSGGVLALATRALSAAESAARWAEVPVVGPVVLLTVSDTGAGMDGETQAKMFEPFFTTKGAARGTGLGLSVVHGIVEQHGGAIRVHSTPGAGTTFELYLPLAEGAAAAPADVEPYHEPRGGDERVLLVEDEPGVRRAVRSMLESAGYRVAEAAGAEEAIDLLARAAEPVDLVVSDVIMPRMNGLELRRVLAESHPGLPVTFVSGYTFDVVRHRGLVEEGTDVLMKPFTVEALLARVREVLDRAEPRPGARADSGR